MKNKNTYISIIISIAVSVLLVAPFGASAADTTATSNPGKKEVKENRDKTNNEGENKSTPSLQITKLNQKGTCYSTLDDKYKKGITTGQYISTEIEEALSKSQQIGETMVKNCFRVTACKDIKRKKTCMSFINEECELVGDQNKITETIRIEAGAEKDKKTTSKQIQSPVQKTSCEKMQLIISPAGTGLFYAYIGMAYRWVASIIGIISVLIIIISGIQISTAAGDPGRADEGKARIIRALSGLAVLFLSGLILYTINPTFFVN